jgi:histidine phosphotransferase ChpT
METSGSPLHLAELLAARLCHEFSGLIGAVASAIGAVEDDGAAALGLAAEAASALTLRLRLWRAAWSEADEMLGVADLLDLLRALPGTRRIAYETVGLPAEVAFSPEATRLLLNVLILATESLPLGGRVLLSGQPSGDVVVAIEGPRAGWPAGFAAWLADAACAWAALGSPRTLQGPLTALMARESGLRLSPLFPAAAADATPSPLLLGLAPS